MGTQTKAAAAAGSGAGQMTHDAHRKLSTSVREVREKLTHKTGVRPEFEYELLHIFARNELSAAIILPIFSLVVALAAISWSPANLVLAWLALLWVAKSALLILCRQFINQPRKEITIHIWRSRLLAAELFYGCSWASFAFIGVTGPDPKAQMFLFVTLIVIISMRMMFASAATPIVYAGTLPMTAAIVLRYALLDTSFYWAMATTAVGVHIFFIFLMRELNSNVLNMLEYKAEKDALIAELEQANAVSDEARLRAEAANYAKSRFLATMSHELRTPLNAILGFSEVMKKELLGAHANPTYKEYSTDINESGAHLLNLINEILDLTRIEAGRYDLNEEPIRLVYVAEDCYRLVKLRAKAKGQTIIETYQEDLLQVWADERAIRQICLNLMTNAIKFTPAGGTITLTVGKTRNGGQYISVRDTGPGIPEDEIPRVLRSFGQGSLAHETAEGGTGLGLPIVRGLINLHDGTFDLKTRLREGTEVIVTLPPKRVMHVLPKLSEPGRQNSRKVSNATAHA